MAQTPAPINAIYLPNSPVARLAAPASEVDAPKEPRGVFTFNEDARDEARELPSEARGWGWCTGSAAGT
jgi:hypothetical protein